MSVGTLRSTPRWEQKGPGQTEGSGSGRVGASAPRVCRAVVDPCPDARTSNYAGPSVCGAVGVTGRGEGTHATNPFIIGDSEAPTRPRIGALLCEQSGIGAFCLLSFHERTCGLLASGRVGAATYGQHRNTEARARSPSRLFSAFPPPLSPCRLSGQPPSGIRFSR